MPKKPFNWWLWTKLLVGGATIAVGGPLLTSYLIPTEEELVKKFSPEVMKIREETKDARMQYAQEFDEYVTRLKRYSKSDKPIWTIIAEENRAAKKAQKQRQQSIAEQTSEMRAQMRKEAGLPPK